MSTAKKSSANRVFVRSTSVGISAAASEKKANAAGIKSSRSNSRGQTKVARPNVATKTSRSASGTKKGGPTKAEFVRSHASMSPKEIVEKAKSAGMKLDIAYVYVIRANAKSAAKKKGHSFAATKPTKATKGGKGTKLTKGGLPVRIPASTVSGGGANDVAFRRLVLSLGVSRAKSLLAEVEQRLSVLISGK